MTKYCYLSDNKFGLHLNDRRSNRELKLHISNMLSRDKIFTVGIDRDTPALQMLIQANL